MSRTEFLAVILLADRKAETLVDSILNLLANIDNTLQRMYALGSDGAAVIVDRKNGVAALLRQRCHHSISNHCVARKGIKYLFNFKD